MEVQRPGIRTVLIVLLTAVPLLVPAPAFAGVNRRTSGGPRSEAVVNALVANPAAADKRHAPTAGGGVFKSDDGGQPWKPGNTDLDLAQQPDGSLALAHTGLTDLRHAMTVTDTASGAVRTYHNATSHPTHAFGGSAELPH